MAGADTIVLVHGLWMNPVSWQVWAGHFTKRGFRVLAPAWPGMEGDVEPFRRDTSGYAGLHAREIVDHYDGIIRGLERPPIVMGHSFGGASCSSCSTGAWARPAWRSTRLLPRACSTSP